MLHCYAAVSYIPYDVGSFRNVCNLRRIGRQLASGGTRFRFCRVVRDTKGPWVASAYFAKLRTLITEFAGDADFDIIAAQIAYRPRVYREPQQIPYHRVVRYLGSALAGSRWLCWLLGRAHGQQEQFCWPLGRLHGQQLTMDRVCV